MGGTGRGIENSRTGWRLAFKLPEKRDRDSFFRRAPGTFVRN